MVGLEPEMPLAAETENKLRNVRRANAKKFKKSPPKIKFFHSPGACMVAVSRIGNSKGSSSMMYSGAVGAWRSSSG